jgi:hypothetical protein
MQAELVEGLVNRLPLVEVCDATEASFIFNSRVHKKVKFNSKKFKIHLKQSDMLSGFP